jgi:hypothetical protein
LVAWPRCALLSTGLIDLLITVIIELIEAELLSWLGASTG